MIIYFGSKIIRHRNVVSIITGERKCSASTKILPEIILRRNPAVYYCAGNAANSYFQHFTCGCNIQFRDNIITEASIETVSSKNLIRIFVTSEDEGAVEKPDSTVVLTTNSF